MKTPNQEDLPLSSAPKEFSIDDQLVSDFNKSFRHDSSTTPPTIGVKSLTGMFEILNSLEVDWKKLLHISQSFDYFDSFSRPCAVLSQAKLIKHRFRAGSHWLQFQTDIKSKDEEKLILRSHSTIMVGQ